MSERPALTPRLAICHCHLCGGGIEFDARDFQTGETRGVECPHCQKRTVIGVERPIPKQFSDFIGQNRVKARLELAIAAAKSRGESLGHILLIGSPGSPRQLKSRLTQMRLTELRARQMARRLMF